MVGGILYSFEYPALSSIAQSKVKRSKCCVLLGEMMHSFDQSLSVLSLLAKHHHQASITSISISPEFRIKQKL